MYFLRGHLAPPLAPSSGVCAISGCCMVLHAFGAAYGLIHLAFISYWMFVSLCPYHGLIFHTDTVLFSCFFTLCLCFFVFASQDLYSHFGPTVLFLCYCCVEHCALINHFIHFSYNFRPVDLVTGSALTTSLNFTP